MIGGCSASSPPTATLAAVGINQTPPRTFSVADDRYPTRDIDVDVLKMYPRADALARSLPGQQVRRRAGSRDCSSDRHRGRRRRSGRASKWRRGSAIVVGDTLVRPRTPLRRGRRRRRLHRLRRGARSADDAFARHCGDEHGRSRHRRVDQDVMVLTIRLSSSALT